jgi:osmoprotectant transport system ATP-binding protein
MDAVVFRDISHAYDAQPVLKHITATIKSDEITVVLGKSGSGKSTLLQMVNGLIRPGMGDVTIFGAPIDYSQLSQLRLNIGYSVQGTSLFPHMTVHENIALLPGINRYDKDKTKQRIVYLMKFVDLDLSYLDKYPYQLSGGEQQRVGICRAMVLNPKIFLLDEAFGALDPATRNDIHQELLNLQKAEPRTILMVTHDVNEAFKLGQNIMILNEGKVEQYDHPDVIQHKPATAFIKNFIQGILD